MKYSATTVFLPRLSLVQQAALLSRLGYDGMELRVRRIPAELRAKAEPSAWGYHVNDVTPETFAAKAAEIRQVLADHGLALAGIASAAACTELDHIKLLVEGAVAAGAPFIRVGAASGYKGDGSQDYWQVYGETVAGYARTLELTRGTGVKIVLEIHGGTIHCSAALAHRIVSHFNPAEVGVIYDPQNMVKDGFETTALAVQLLGPYLAHCHVGAHRPLPPSQRDAKGTAQWTWEACPLADGLYHFPTLINQLRKTGYRHFISIEDFRQVAPEAILQDAITYLLSLEHA